MKLFSRGARSEPVHVRRGLVEATLSAWAAVRAEIPLERWLSRRLDRHMAAAVGDDYFPSFVPSIEDGGYVDRPGPLSENPIERALANPSSEGETDEVGEYGVRVRATRAMLRAAADRINRDRAALQQDIARLRAETMDAREQFTDAKIAAQRGLAEGATLPAESLARSAETRGRPSPLPAWRFVAYGSVALAALAAESAACFVIFANISGIDPRNLPVEWEQSSSLVAGIAAQAVCTPLATFVAFGWACELIAAVYEGRARGWRAAVNLTGTAAFALVYLAVVAAIAWDRAALQLASAGAGTSRTVLFASAMVFTGAFPLVAAYMHRLGRAWAARCEARDAEIAAFDRREEERRAQGDRDRAAIATLAAEEAALEAHSRTAEERLRALEAEADALPASLRARLAAWRDRDLRVRTALRAAIAEDATVYSGVAAWLGERRLLRTQRQLAEAAPVDHSGTFRLPASGAVE